jgi:transcriptional regulator with XRE-family HTH domain
MAGPKITSPRISRVVPSPLRRERLLQGLRQVDLSAIVGISQATLSEIELGQLRPSPRLRARFATALEVDIRILFPSEADRGALGE